MKRDTSSVESIASSDGASESRSSRSVTIVPVSTGSDCRQSVVVATAEVPASAACTSGTSLSR